MEVALLNLGLEALQHGALLPVGLMAMDDSTTAIIELRAKLCRAGFGVPCVLKRASPRSCPCLGSRGDKQRKSSDLAGSIWWNGIKTLKYCGPSARVAELAQYSDAAAPPVGQ